MNCWKYLEVVGVFVGVKCVLDTDHLLVQFFTRTNSDNFVLGIGRNSTRYVQNIHRWRFFNINLTTYHIFKCPPDLFYTLF